MAHAAPERLSTLREQIERQRATVEALKRDGHEYADAERHLHTMEGELRSLEPLRAAE